MNADAPVTSGEEADWLNDSIIELQNTRGKLARARSEKSRKRLTSKIRSLEKDLGWELLQRGRYEEGLLYYRSLAEKEMDEDTCVGLSWALEELNQYEEVERILEESLKSYPESAPLLLNAGNFYSKQMNFEKALEHYEMARLIDPDDDACQASCADALNDLVRYDDACVIYTNLLVKSGSFPPPLYQIKLGYCNLNIGYPEAAAALFKAALDNNNDDPEAWTVKGNAVDVRNADAYNGLSCAYFDMGKKDDAVNTLLEGLSKYPDQDSDLYHNLGVFYADMEWLSGARDVVHRGLALFPEDENLISLLKSLDEGDDDPNRDVTSPIEPLVLVLG